MLTLTLSTEQKMYQMMKEAYELKQNLAGKPECKLEYQIATRIHMNAFCFLLKKGMLPEVGEENDRVVLSVTVEGIPHVCPAKSVKSVLKNEFETLETKIPGLAEKVLQEEQADKAAQKAKKNPSGSMTESKQPKFLTPQSKREERPRVNLAAVLQEKQAIAEPEVKSVPKMPPSAEEKTDEGVATPDEGDAVAPEASEKTDSEKESENPEEQSVSQVQPENMNAKTDVPESNVDEELTQDAVSTDTAEEGEADEHEAVSQEVEIPAPEIDAENAVAQRNDEQSDDTHNEAVPQENLPQEEEVAPEVKNNDEELGPQESKEEELDASVVTEQEETAEKDEPEVAEPEDTESVEPESDVEAAPTAPPEAETSAEPAPVDTEEKPHHFMARDPEPQQEEEEAAEQTEIATAQNTEEEPETNVQPGHTKKKNGIGGIFGKFLPKSAVRENAGTEPESGQPKEPATQDDIRDDAEFSNELPGVTLCHTHIIKLKKTFGNAVSDSYVFYIWPTEVIEMYPERIPSAIFVYAKSPNGTVVQKVSDAKIKYVTLTLDGKQFNVFGVWQNGKFETEVALINKTASVYSKIEVIKADDPDVAYDSMLDPFRSAKENRKPEYFIVPLSKTNRGKENVAIAAFARVNDKNYVISTPGQTPNSLLVTSANITSQITGRWTDRQFTFDIQTVDPE